MKVRVTGKGFTLSEIPLEQMDVIMKILCCVKDGCFDDAGEECRPKDSFRLGLSDDEYVLFHSFGLDYWKYCVKMYGRNKSKLKEDKL
jgi:hypothetical protein